jgi:hypothetical protein
VVVYQSGTNTTAFTAVGTSGQVLVSNGTSAPTWSSAVANLSGGVASQIPYQSSAGTTAFIANGTTGQALVSNGTSAPGFGTLAPAGGGTGLTTFTSGGAVYANSTNTLTTGTLPIAGGGTNSTSTPTAGTVAYGTGTAFDFTAAGSSGQVLQSNAASAPTWVNISTLVQSTPSFLLINAGVS